jgi:hypothetical protein
MGADAKRPDTTTLAPAPHNNNDVSRGRRQGEGQWKTAGRGNDGRWQGWRTTTAMHKQAGPNDDYVVWALGKFFFVHFLF